MIRPNLLAWQWRDYVAKHRDRTNLLIHIVAVPLFQVATLLLVGALLGRSLIAAIVAVIAMVIALVLQAAATGANPKRRCPLTAPRTS